MLDLFETTQQKIDNLTAEYHIAHARWALWLNWAKKHPGYDLWQINEGLRMSDLKADIRKISSQHKHLTFDRTMSAGTIYFASRKQIWWEKEQLKQKRSDMLKSIWFRWKKGSWVYSLPQIAKAYGRSIPATHKLLQSQTWYETRQAYKLRKFTNQHSRPITPQTHLYGIKIT